MPGFKDKGAGVTQQQLLEPGKGKEGESPLDLPQEMQPC